MDVVSAAALLSFVLSSFCQPSAPAPVPAAAVQPTEPPPFVPAPTSAAARAPVLPIHAVSVFAGVHRVAALPPLPAPLSGHEVAHYRIRYGILGGLGEARLYVEDVRMDGERRLVAARGWGQGSLLGFGRMEKKVETALDSGALTPRRWTSSRKKDGKDITVSGDQPAAGQVAITRREGTNAPSSSELRLAEPALDPVGLLLRLRVTPPAPGALLALNVFDGGNLWRVFLRGAGSDALPSGDSTTTRALRFDGRAEPVSWSGQPDPGRTARSFVLWLSSDDTHMPLRLSVPLPLGEVVAELVASHRTPAPPQEPALSRRP